MKEKKENGYSCYGFVLCVCVWVGFFCGFFFLGGGGHAGFLLLCEGFRGL